MIDDLGGATANLVKLALDATLLRHHVIANNIANANTSGFRPQYVSFEEHLGRAARELPGAAADRRLDADVEALRKKLESGQLLHASPAAKVEIDQEMARLSANVVRYQALLDGLGKRGDVIKMAISGQGGR